jgi:uncharacterized GH25 family protein
MRFPCRRAGSRPRLPPAAPSAVLAWCLLASFVSAHDFWIEPSTFRPAVGSELAVALRVGQDFRGDPVPRNSKLIKRFALVSNVAETPISGFDGVEPAGIVRVAEPGVLWVVYRSGITPVTLEADKFEKYLAEEGLEKIHVLRQRRGESEKPGREIFSRSVKSLLVAESGSSRGFDRALGLTLEIVLKKDPGALAAGDSLPLTLLYEGEPLEGALVTAMEHENPTQKVKSRTDRRGQALLQIGQKGVWLIKAVQMIPAPPGVDADWESIWTSVTFEIP